MCMCEKDSDLVSISHWKSQNNIVPKSLSEETFHKIYIKLLVSSRMAICIDKNDNKTELL